MTAPPLLIQGLVATVEGALNAYLRLDPSSAAPLNALSGKVIAIELREVDRTFYLLPSASGIQVCSQYEGLPDATLRGTLWALLWLGTQKGSDGQARAALFSGAVEISGDVELGQHFKRILDDMSVDWEELVSKVSGDILAHQAANTVRQAQTWGAHLLVTLGQNFAEYQQEESRNLPTQAEVDELLKAVDTLRDDVERIEQRMYRLRYAIGTTTAQTGQSNSGHANPHIAKRENGA